MQDASETLAALRRLQSAMDVLEATIGRAQVSQETHTATRTDVALMEADRARLAEELDAAASHIAGLETVQRDVSRRIEAAMAEIGAVLDGR